MIALEETGASFETHLVAFMAGDHRKSEFLARNPSGKVPVLMVDGQPIVQTVAILGFLDESFPDAKLFPARSTPLRGRSFSATWSLSALIFIPSSPASPFRRS